MLSQGYSILYKVSTTLYDSCEGVGQTGKVHYTSKEVTDRVICGTKLNTIEAEYEMSGYAE